MATESWRTCRRHDDGMRPPKFRLNRYIGKWVMPFPTFSNMAAVRHLELEFCHSGPPTKSTMRSDYRMKIWCWSDLPAGDIAILWFCQCGCKMRNYAPFKGFLGFELLKIVGRHPNSQKAHPWVNTRDLSHKRFKSVQGFDLGTVARKNV